MPLIRGNNNKDNKNIGNRNAGLIGNRNAPSTAPSNSGAFIDGDDNSGNSDLANDNTGQIGDDNTGGNNSNATQPTQQVAPTAGPASSALVSGNVYKITNVAFPAQHVVEYMLPSWQTTSIGSRPYASSVNQKWIFEKNGSLWAIRSFIMNNIYLAPGTNIGASIPVRQYYSSKGAAEASITTTPFYWKIEQTGASRFRIRDPVTNKCLFLADSRVGATQAEYFYPVYVIPQTNALCEMWTIESV